MRLQPNDYNESQAYCIPLVIAPSPDERHFLKTRGLMASHIQTLWNQSEEGGFVRENLRFVICHNGKSGIELSAPVCGDKVANLLRIMPNHLPGFTFQKAFDTLQEKRGELPQFIGALATACKMNGDNTQELQSTGMRFRAPIVGIMNPRRPYKKEPGAMLVTDALGRTLKPDHGKRGAGFSTYKDERKMEALSRGSGVSGTVGIDKVSFKEFKQIIYSYAGPDVYAEAVRKGAIEDSALPKEKSVAPVTATASLLRKKPERTVVMIGTSVEVPLRTLPTPISAPPVPTSRSRYVAPRSKAVPFVADDAHDHEDPFRDEDDRFYELLEKYRRKRQEGHERFQRRYERVYKEIEAENAALRRLSKMSLFPRVGAVLGMGLAATALIMSICGRKAVDSYKERGPDPQPVFKTFDSVRVQFGRNSAALQDGQKAGLENLVKELRDSPVDKRCVVEGYSNSSGPADYNMALSERRVDALKAFLRANGIEAEIQTFAHGEAKASVPAIDADRFGTVGCDETGMKNVFIITPMEIF